MSPPRPAARSRLHAPSARSARIRPPAQRGDGARPERHPAAKAILESLAAQERAEEAAEERVAAARGIDRFDDRHRNRPAPAIRLGRMRASVPRFSTTSW